MYTDCQMFNIVRIYMHTTPDGLHTVQVICQDGGRNVCIFDLSDLKRMVEDWKRWWSETTQADEVVENQVMLAWLQ